MALVRWEPRSRMLDIRDEIDRLFDRFWRKDTAEERLPMGAWYPTADIAERDDAYVVTMDIPGVSRDEVKVRIADNVLTISGEKSSEEKEEDRNYRLMERHYGSFRRSFSLPSAVKEGEISAAFKDGVLTVTLPKSEETKVKQIEVG